MNIIPRFPRRFKNRVRLIFSAIFSKTSDLEATMASIQKTPDVDLKGWGNPYDILGQFPSQKNSLDDDILELCNRDLNAESSEIDVINFLYNFAVHTQARKIIEVGVYHGAASLSMSQALADNGGGEIHLVDISKGYLDKVHSRITEKNWPVRIYVHLVEKNAKSPPDALPQADILFVDADHTYEGVKNDLMIYRPLVASRGSLILHDTIKHEGPRKMVSDLFYTGHKTCTIATSQGSGLTVLRL